MNSGACWKEGTKWNHYRGLVVKVLVFLVGFNT